MNLNRDFYSTTDYGELIRFIRGGRATTWNNTIVVNLPMAEVRSYWDFYHIMLHERQHMLNDQYYGGGMYGEFNTHYWETQQTTFKNTTREYKLYTLKALNIYLGDIAGEVTNYEQAERYYEKVEKYRVLYKQITGNEIDEASFALSSFPKASTDGSAD